MSDTSGGLLASLRRLLAHGLETFQVRVELLAVELEQEKQRLFDALLWAVLALLLLGIGLLLAVGLLLMLFWDGYRLAVLAGLSLSFLLGAVGVAALARRRLCAPHGMLPDTRAELARDLDALRPPR